MGVPAFYRWLTEKYPKVVQDVLEERVHLLAGPGSHTAAPFDATRPNPSGLECDALYIDMNGIIHPCSHPEDGAVQPKTEQDMYEAVCRYIDRLFRALRPRKLLYLAIDGVAPRAKMNQQRSRRFRAAQEARELAEMERHIKVEMQNLGQDVPISGSHAGGEKDDANSNGSSNKPWDSNVITPGTPFMLRLAEFVRFYIRKRMATDAAWKPLRVLFSDASIPGEGEHKIMSHIRLQRSQPGYNVNTVHILHGLDADLIMLGLATHEAHFYISREEVLFGRASMEQQEQRQQESGFRDAQIALNEAAVGGAWAMALPENSYKPLQRVSIPILREYLAVEFAPCLDARRLQTFAPSLERVIDDFVFLCFFVGNDFLPHLPSLDIRDGALDFLLNVYKRILPSLGDYITKSGGNVNLQHVNVILAEVGAIEDYVFQMKHDGEQRERQRRQEQKSRNNKQGNKGPQPLIEAAATEPAAASPASNQHRQGRAGKILQRQEAGPVPTRRSTKQQQQQQQQPIQVSHMKGSDNAKAAQALRDSLFKSQKEPEENDNTTTTVDNDNDKSATAKSKQRESFLFGEEECDKEEEDFDSGKDDSHEFMDSTTAADEPDGEGDGEKKPSSLPSKRKRSEDNDDKKITADENGVGIVGNVDEEFDADEGDNDDAVVVDVDDDDDVDDDFNIPIESVVAKTAEELDAISAAFKEKVKAAQQQKLDSYAKNVQDNVRLHEAGWKDRYYSDKCKADDVSAHGGREHLFRSYIVGLCWTMKYYYEGCVSYKWFYPFHYVRPCNLYMLYTISLWFLLHCLSSLISLDAPLPLPSRFILLDALLF
jgi:5'-3' exoribonuclease 2